MGRLHLRTCGLLVVSLAVFLFFACGAASAEQIKITFVDKVEVDGLSILIGDYLFSQALINISKLNDLHCIDILSNISKRLSEGEIMQIFVEGLEPDSRYNITIYTDKVRYRTLEISTLTV